MIRLAPELALPLLQALQYEVGCRFHRLVAPTRAQQNDMATSYISASAATFNQLGENYSSELAAVPPPEEFAAWDGVVIGAELLKEFGLVPPRSPAAPTSEARRS